MNPGTGSLRNRPRAKHGSLILAQCRQIATTFLELLRVAACLLAASANNARRWDGGPSEGGAWRHTWRPDVPDASSGRCAPRPPRTPTARVRFSNLN